MTDKQKEILKKIRALPLRKYGSVKHKRLIQEYIKHDPHFPSSKVLRWAQEAGAQAYKLSSWRRQASHPRAKGSSFKPESTSSRIFEPGYKRTSPRSGVQATRIKVFFLCLTWKATWWGEKVILLPNVTFSSSVKKFPLTAYPNKSGVPCKLRFSSLFHDIFVIFLLSSLYNLASGFRWVTSG